MVSETPGFVQELGAPKIQLYIYHRFPTNTAILGVLPVSYQNK